MKVEISEAARLPSLFGDFQIQCFKDEKGKEHLAVFSENLNMEEAVNLRIHSECLTGDVLGSLKCDCREQLLASLKFLNEKGGMLIYHRQEGRNIGLFNKINAYSLQDQGFNTIEANLHLGFAPDERTYEIVDFILAYYGIKEIKLLSNNPKKLSSIKAAEVKERLPLIIKANSHNREYLNIKERKMGHILHEIK